MKKNTIYLPLQGRIGNQLFQYALARKIQLDMNDDTVIIMDDSDILRCKWENSLINYNLPNVKYQHESIITKDLKGTTKYFLRKVYRFLTRKKDYLTKYQVEKKLNFLFGKSGMFICENGYLKPQINKEKPIYLEGYFQSPKYFDCIKDDLSKLFTGQQFEKFEDYPELDKIGRAHV